MRYGSDNERPFGPLGYLASHFPTLGAGSYTLYVILTINGKPFTYRVIHTIQESTTPTGDLLEILKRLEFGSVEEAYAFLSLKNGRLQTYYPLVDDGIDIIGKTYGQLNYPYQDTWGRASETLYNLTSKAYIQIGMEEHISRSVKLVKAYLDAIEVAEKRSLMQIAVEELPLHINREWITPRLRNLYLERLSTLEETRTDG